MRTVPVSKFKDQCLRLIDEVDAEGITITRHGKPVARLVPVTAAGDTLWAYYGSLAGQLKYGEDDLSTGLAWDAES